MRLQQIRSDLQKDTTLWIMLLLQLIGALGLYLSFHKWLWDHLEPPYGRFATAAFSLLFYWVPAFGSIGRLGLFLFVRERRTSSALCALLLLYSCWFGIIWMIYFVTPLIYQK